MTKLSGPMVPPKSDGAPKQAVVLLHGYGSDGADLIGLADYWRDMLPEAVFLAPNGPARCADFAAGYQWFRVEQADLPYRFVGANEARPVIIEFLGDLWAQTSLRPEDTLLGGFSQGAMMALNVALCLDASLMGVLSFSGALIEPPGFEHYAGPRPPVCLVHGDADTVVDVSLSRHASEVLEAKGFDVRFHVSPAAPHTIAPDGLQFATAFIASVSSTG